MLGCSDICPRLVFPLSVSCRVCLKEAETPGTTKGNDMAVPSAGCAACRSAALATDMGIAQRHPRLGRSFSAPLPLKMSSRATEEVGGNLWDEAVLSLPHSANTGEIPIAVKGQNKSGSYSGAVSSQARGPGQPLQGHLLCSCFRGCLAWSVQPPLLTACFTSGLAIFNSLVLNQVESSLSEAVVQPGTYKQLPENMGTANNLSAFILHTWTLTVPSLLAGQLLSWDSFYHLQ